MLQDNGRGLLVGYNTNGAGGTVGDGFGAGPYSEGSVNVTLSMMVRKAPVNSVYGPTAYVENVGVQPDITIDYMTLDNLVNGGVTFLNQVIAVLTQLVQAGAPGQ
jgi:C-terminal processing protease CtpA/Prc